MWRKWRMLKMHLTSNFGSKMNFIEITVFFFHSNIVTATLESSEGGAYVYGRSVVKHVNAIRQDLGVCPQQNILFD